MRLVARYGVDRALLLGDADSRALQRGEEVHAHHRVGDFVLEQLGQPVAQVVLEVAEGEAVQHRVRQRVARDVGDRHVAHLLVDRRDDARRRHARVDHEAQAAAPLQRLPLALAEDLHAALHDLAVGDDHRFPVARLDQGRAPADVAHLSREAVDAHPVADLHGVVDLDGEAAEQVAERVLHGEGDHRREDRGGRDDAREVDPGAAQLHEAVDHVRHQDDDVLDDARPLAPYEWQEEPKCGKAGKANDRDRGDDAKERLHHGSGVGERQGIERDRARLAEHADQEQPQRIQVDRALRGPELQEQDREREGEQRQPGHIGMQQPAQAVVVLAHQKRIRPMSMSRHITQSPRKLYQGWVKVAGRFFSKKKCPTQANA